MIKEFKILNTWYSKELRKAIEIPNLELKKQKEDMKKYISYARCLSWESKILIFSVFRSFSKSFKMLQSSKKLWNGGSYWPSHHTVLVNILRIVTVLNSRKITSVKWLKNEKKKGILLSHDERHVYKSLTVDMASYASKKPIQNHY